MGDVAAASKRRRPMTWAAVAVAVVVLAGVLSALATARLAFWGRTDVITSADAVFVLSGDHGDRLAKGLKLMARGVAPTLVLDGEPDFQRVADMCTSQQPFEVVCLRPAPDSTRAEAQAGARLARDRGWRQVVVVTSAEHAPRAGLLFRRCVTGEVKMVATKPPLPTPPGAIRHERLGLLAALTFLRGC